MARSKKVKTKRVLNNKIRHSKKGLNNKNRHTRKGLNNKKNKTIKQFGGGFKLDDCFKYNNPSKKNPDDNFIYYYPAKDIYTINKKFDKYCAPNLLNWYKPNWEKQKFKTGDEKFFNENRDKNKKYYEDYYYEDTETGYNQYKKPDDYKENFWYSKEPNYINLRNWSQYNWSQVCKLSEEKQLHLFNLMIFNNKTLDKGHYRIDFFYDNYGKMDSIPTEEKSIPTEEKSTYSYKFIGFSFDKDLFDKLKLNTNNMRDLIIKYYDTNYKNNITAEGIKKYIEKKQLHGEPELSLNLSYTTILKMYKTSSKYSEQKDDINSKYYKITEILNAKIEELKNNQHEKQKIINEQNSYDVVFKYKPYIEVYGIEGIATINEDIVNEEEEKDDDDEMK